MDKLAKEKGEVVPALEKEPEVRFDLLWVWNGFQRLCGTKVVVLVGTEVVEQPILMTEIKSYCYLNGIRDERSLILFTRFVQAMDRVLIDHNRQAALKRAKTRAKADSKS